MSLLLRVAVALLPASIRDRYREQWQADARDAAELGLSRSDIASGALIFALSVNRRAVDPVAPTELARRRVRSGLALTLSGLVVAFGMYVGGATVSVVPLVAGLQAVLVSVQSAIVIVGVVGGLGLLVAGAVASGIRSVAAIIGVLVLVLGYVFLGLSTVAYDAALVAVLLVPGGVLTLWVWSMQGRVPVPVVPSSGRSKRRAVLGVTVMLVAVAALGVVDGLVWMPLALAPDYSLAQIYAALETQGSFAQWGPVVWAILVAIAAVSTLVAFRHATAFFIVTAGLALGSAAILLQWFFAFGIGNGVSDALPPYVGGNSGFAPFFWFAGQLMLVAVIGRVFRARAVPAMAAA